MLSFFYLIWFFSRFFILNPCRQSSLYPPLVINTCLYDINTLSVDTIRSARRHFPYMEGWTSDLRRAGESGRRDFFMWGVRLPPPPPEKDYGCCLSSILSGFPADFYPKPILAIIVVTVIVVNITHLRYKYTSRRHYSYPAKTHSVHERVDIRPEKGGVGRVGVIFMWGV